MNSILALHPGSAVRLLSPQIAYHFNKTQAIFIHQLHYWIQKGQGVVHEERRWIYNTASQWATQIMVSERQFKRIIAELAKKGVLLVAKLSRFKSDRTNYVTINYDVLAEILTSQTKRGDSVPNTAPFSSVSRDKMSPASGQNVPMIIQRLQTNTKDNLIEDASRLNETGSVNEGSHQVDLVKNENILKIEGKGAEATFKASKKTTTAQDMLSFWNITFSKAQTKMSKDLAPRLVAAFKAKFDSNLERWKHYCKTIESSNFIMGEKFNLSIFWALQFSTIDRIRGGEWGVKDIPILVDNIEGVVLNHLTHLNEPPACMELRKTIIQRYGLGMYQSWFTRVQLYLENGRILLKAPSKFMEETIINRFQELRT